MLADVVGREVGTQHRFSVIPEAFPRFRIEMTGVIDRKIIGIVRAIAVAVALGFPEFRGHVVEIVVGKNADDNQIMIEFRGECFVQQGVLEGTKIAAGAEIQVFPAGVALEDVGEADVGGSTEPLDKRIAENDGAVGGGIHSTLNITGSVTVGVVFDGVATALVNEMAVGAVPDSEGGIDVGPEGVVIDVITGAAGRPFFGMNQDERSEFG